MIEEKMTSESARKCEVAARTIALYKILRTPEILNGQPNYWVDQVSRSVLSVASNWVEGIGRGIKTRSEMQFFRIARGSGYEAAIQLHMHGLSELCSEMDAICNIMESFITQESTEIVEEEVAAIAAKLKKLEPPTIEIPTIVAKV